MTEQVTTKYWYTGVYDAKGLEYFEPATPENALFAIRRAKGLNEHRRNAKAFSVPLNIETEECVLELLKIGQLHYARLVISNQRDIQYVK